MKSLFAFSRFRMLAISLVALATIAAGCGGSDDASVSADGSAETEAQTEAEGDADSSGESESSSDVDTTAKPVISVPAGDPPTELIIEDLLVGDGAEATAGDPISVDYVGVSWSTQEEFDASWDRGSEFGFSLGVGQVIPGWDEGVQGMKVGGRRQITIPPEMAYGANGAGGAIGPNETLIFVVDLRAIN